MMEMDPMEARMLVMEHLVKDDLLLDMLEDWEGMAHGGLPSTQATTGEDVSSSNDWLLVIVKACQL